jgi:hypothetical protein
MLCLRQVVACFRTCLTKNGSQRGRAPTGQRPQPPSGGAWPRLVTQHPPPPLWKVRPLVALVRESPTAYWWVNLRWPHMRPSVFPSSLSLAYSSAAVVVPYRLPLHAALLGSWITAGAWSLTLNRMQAPGIHFQLFMHRRRPC